ncbi:MAG TPA: hypothetical protein VFX84_03125 [Candidatus Saccharimonadales bacterium]|nr:hypothetical protein [Candidatus Saccharimonadales bacterium]
MSGAETLDPQFQADTMMSVLNERLAAASPVEDLSVHSDRILQVMEEPDGSRFVRRGFTDEGVSYVQRSGLSFREAWEGMEDTYAAVGVDVVPSFIFEQEGEHSFVVISEYVPDAVDVSELPTEEKVKLVQGLGKLFKPEAEYWPSLEALRADTFKGVEQEDGTFRVLMMDTDPFVIPAPSLARDEYVGQYIKKLSEILWDDWCDQDDRGEVAAALVISLAESLDEEEYAGMHNTASRAFMNLHMMSNGMDPRGTGVDMLD